MWNLYGISSLIFLVTLFHYILLTYILLYIIYLLLIIYYYFFSNVTLLHCLFINYIKLDVKIYILNKTMQLQVHIVSALSGLI